MPRLWQNTIDAHRRSVHDAILDAAGTLVTDRGLLSVTMSQIADQAGIGRATLYKYFPEVEAILVAWHERHVTAHLDQLTELTHNNDEPGERLETVLQAYAAICHHRGRHGTELGALLHRPEHVAPAEQQVVELLQRLIADAAHTSAARDDVPAEELASYCLHALAAASTLPSEAAVRRLLAVTLAGLRPSD